MMSRKRRSQTAIVGGVRTLGGVPPGRGHVAKRGRMFGRRLGTVGMVVVGVMLLVAFAAIGADGPLTSEEELGKSIFFDQALSLNRSQSCASCHDPDVGFTGPDSATNAGSAVYEGSFAGRFGDRKPPSAAYATQSPLFHLDKHGTFSGGNFWDGRATGEVLGNPAADQAQGPFLNPNEQALSDSACVVYRVCNANAEDYPVSCGVKGPATSHGRGMSKPIVV